MKSKKNLKGLVAAIILIASVLFMSFSILSSIQQEPWEVPAEYKDMKNPVEANDESLMVGKGLYNKYCASCHGKKGLGDGVKARQIDTFPGDFSGEAYQKQTDGEHFYKTKVGRDEMPGYEGKVSDEDMWHMVNYMRTFKK